MLILLTTLSILLMIYVLQLKKTIYRKNELIGVVSKDYIKKTREAQSYKEKHDSLMMQYGKDVGFFQ